MTMSDYGELRDVLRQRFAAHWLVGLDGAREAGKSTIARRLASDLGRSLISVDDYVRQGVGTPYADLVRLDELRAALASPDKGSKVLIEGICLLTLLDRLGVALGALIYVVRASAPGEWSEVDLFDDTVTEADLVARCGPVPSTAGASLDRDLAIYHKRARPHERADIVYERIEGE
jgi:hypothetical protein